MILKSLLWGTPETTATDALTLLSKRTCCLLLQRNFNTMDKICLPSPIDLSLRKSPRILTLSNAAEKFN